MAMRGSNGELRGVSALVVMKRADRRWGAIQLSSAPQATIDGQAANTWGVAIAMGACEHARLLDAMASRIDNLRPTAIRFETSRPDSLGDEMMSLIAPCPQKAHIPAAFALTTVTPTGKITMASEAQKFRCLDRLPPKPLYQWARPILIPSHRPYPYLAGVSFVIGPRRLSVIQYCGLSSAT